jgi:uncharacterized protein with GYD domain
MAVYVMLTRLTSEGLETLKKRPERIHEVNREVELMGARVLHQYAVLGPYDFINVLEAPSPEVAAKVAIELGSRGTMHCETLAAVHIEQLVHSLRD